MNTLPPQGQFGHHIANQICVGTLRCFAERDYFGAFEVTLANRRRADILTVEPKGEIAIAEIKSSVEDFRSDAKWHEYIPYCDKYYFAVSQAFPTDILPEHTGLIIADAFGGDIVRPAEEHRLPAARRKALTLKVARLASMRLNATNLQPQSRLRSISG